MASLTDSSDRAQSHRAPGLARIPLSAIAFWPHNRGGAGISSHHVHEVAHDCVANRTRLSRYGEVVLVEISAEALSQVRRVNTEKAKADPLLPRCYPDEIKYVCLTKTHFVHAQKLAADGGRTLYNDGKVPITWQDCDTEGQSIMEHGPMCAVYRSELFSDNDALVALASDDNLNAGVQMGEDEMRRLRKRRNAVAFIKGTREYDVYQKALAMRLALRCLEPDPEALPPIPKKKWERSIQAWRGVLQAIDARWGDLVRFAESGGAVDGAAGGGGQ